VHTGFCLRNFWERDHMKYLGVDWRTIINDPQEIVWDNGNCTNLDQDEHKWQAVVIVVMNMRAS
jgi:hypothetical protein